MNALKEKLDTVERNKFRKLEAVVAEGITSFMLVGESLKEIRDTKLYRESYKTFEKYVDQKWGMQKSHAYRLIDASIVSQNLSPIGDKNERVAEIKNEAQLRELKDVPAESIEAIVNKAADIAGDNTITASDIKQAREQVLESKPKGKPELTPKERASFLKKSIKQYNAYMMRAVDDLQTIVKDKTQHDIAHKSFRDIDESMNRWAAVK